MAARISNMDQVHEQLDRDIRRIDEHGEWSDQARTVAKARAWKRATDAAQILREQNDNAIRTQRKDLAREFLGYHYRGPVTGQDALSRRDAQDRAATIEDPAEALALLERAERSQDEHLASAIAERAAELSREPKWAAVAYAYAQTRPNAAKALEALQELPDLNDLQTQYNYTWHFSVPTPPGLVSDEYKLEQLAETDIPNLDRFDDWQLTDTSGDAA